jgi:FkbM family methyltransferase
MSEVLEGAPGDRRAAPEFVFHAGAEADIQAIFRFEDYPLNRIAAADMGCIVDIGAHCGAFSYLCAKLYPAVPVVAFEPLRINHDLCVRNTMPFGQVSVRNIGLSDFEGKLKIFYAPDWGFAASSSIKSCNHADEFELVRVARASVALAEIGRMGILKIDTEGHECRILRDLAGRLPDVSFVFLEVHADADRMRIDALLADDFELFYARCDMINRYKLGYVNRQQAGAGLVCVAAAPSLSA